MDIHDTFDFRNNSISQKTKAERVTSSVSFADIIKNTQSTEAIKPTSNISSSNPILNTNKGYIDVDLDEYFSNDIPKHEGPISIDDLPPLMLPSADNIQAISEHVSGRFQELMKEYGIPEAPEKITFDGEGQMQIPLDYPYSDKLRQMMDDNPGLERELQTLNALSSHYAELKKREPFIEEMSKANSQKEIDFIIQKYQHLLNNNHSYSVIELNFSPEGTVQVMADNQPLNLFS